MQSKVWLAINGCTNVLILIESNTIIIQNIEAQKADGSYGTIF